MYVKYPLSLRNVEDLLAERGIESCHETVRPWWNRFGPMFAAEIRRRRVDHMRAYTHWRWHLDEVYVRINGEMHYLWRTIDHEGELLESFVTRTRDKAAALKFIKKALKRNGRPKAIVTDGLRSYRAAIKHLSNNEKQVLGRPDQVEDACRIGIAPLPELSLVETSSHWSDSSPPNRKIDLPTPQPQLVLSNRSHPRETGDGT